MGLPFLSSLRRMLEVLRRRAKPEEDSNEANENGQYSTRKNIYIFFIINTS